MRVFRDRVAVVTGAGSGIGRAVATALAREGAVLALSDVNDAGLAETADAARTLGARVATDRIDVADRAAVHAYADRVVAAHGGVNLVVNNAGVALAARIAEMSYEDLEWLFGINFWGVVHGTKAFLPHLKRADEGHIVNVSSVFGIIAVPGQAAYNAAKFAVRGFTECLREELELEGAHVSATCVHPGGIKTNIARNARMGVETLGGPTRAERDAEFDRIARTTPEAAAERILGAVRRNARRVLIGADAYAIDLLQRLLPTSYQRAVVAVARRSPIAP